MIGAFLDVVRASRLRTLPIRTPITRPFDAWSTDSLNRAITLESRQVLWYPVIFDNDMVARWAAAALMVPYTEDVGRNVVDGLLQIASLDPLQPHIPVDVWALLKKRPPLPPVCMGRSRGTMDCVVRRVRELGDAEILKSYLILIWSEWNIISSEGFTSMCVSIREDFCGIGMRGHREGLVERLDHVLGQLDPGSEFLKQRRTWIDKDPQRTRGQYQQLKEILLEMDMEATEILTSMPSRSTGRFNSLTPVCIRRIPLDIYLCAPVPIAACLWGPPPVPASPCFGCTLIQLCHPLVTQLFDQLMHLPLYPHHCYTYLVNTLPRLLR